jgi:sugar-specific transcriptional regulator TrmB
MQTLELLKKLGLNEKESRIYLALLESGAMLPQHIARATGIKRSTLYELFPEMIGRGFVIELKQGGRRLLSAVSPKVLFDEYELRFKEVKNGLEELTAIYRMQGYRPKVDYYEGFEGIKRLYRKTLEDKSEIKNYVQVSRNNEQVINWLMESYVPSRVRKRIAVRAIVPSESESDKYMPAGPRYLREVKKVSWKQFPFRIEAMIQGNKLYFATYEKGGPLVGIIIESRQIAETQSALFDLAWIGAEVVREK